MVFCGAESGSTDTLARMNKGGTAAAELTLDLARRMKSYGIVPEFSFVVGNPPDPEGDLRHTLAFIRRVKRINPAAEIILYVYSPVPAPRRPRFRFPETLDEWVSDRWQAFSLRRDPRTPWSPATIRRRVRDFETVLNAYYPTVTDTRLTPSAAACCAPRRRGGITREPSRGRSSSTCCSACSTTSARKRRGSEMSRVDRAKRPLRGRGRRTYRAARAQCADGGRAGGRARAAAADGRAAPCSTRAAARAATRDSGAAAGARASSASIARRPCWRRVARRCVRSCRPTYAPCRSPIASCDVVVSGLMLPDVARSGAGCSRVARVLRAWRHRRVLDVASAWAPSWDGRARSRRRTARETLPAIWHTLADHRQAPARRPGSSSRRSSNRRSTVGTVIPTRPRACRWRWCVRARRPE